MLDLIGAIAASAAYAAVVGILVGSSTAGAAQKRAILIAAAGCGAMIVALAALGGFAPGVAGPVPTPAFAFAALMAVLFGSWFLFPAFRDALLSVPLQTLVAINGLRVGGVLFLLLYAEGRLSAPFAPSAGWGDIATGMLAIPLALQLGRNGASPNSSLALWNAFGMLDLIVAISLGVVSAPGTPFQVFTNGPGTLAMTQLPWIIVPSLLVPMFLLIHLTIAAKTSTARRPTRALAAR